MIVYSAQFLWSDSDTRHVTYHRSKRAAVRDARAVLRADAEAWRSYARSVLSGGDDGGAGAPLGPALLNARVLRHLIESNRKADILLALNGIMADEVVVLDVDPTAERDAWALIRAARY